MRLTDVHVVLCHIHISDSAGSCTSPCMMNRTDLTVLMFSMLSTQGTRVEDFCNHGAPEC